MTILQFGPLLAIAGAACLVAWTPEERPPPPEVATLGLGSGSHYDAAPTETASVTGAAPQLSLRPQHLGINASQRTLPPLARGHRRRA